VPKCNRNHSPGNWVRGQSGSHDQLQDPTNLESTDPRLPLLSHRPRLLQLGDEAQSQLTESRNDLAVRCAEVLLPGGVFLRIKNLLCTAAQDGEIGGLIPINPVSSPSMNEPPERIPVKFSP
jgi:hypothetical protein